MKRFASCILHIGTEKTGSTTLQRLLAINRAALLDGAGIFVPKSLSPRRDVANHSRLTTYALADIKRSADLMFPAGVKDAASHAEHRNRVAADCDAEVAALPDGRFTLLLSNEHCHSRLTAEADVARLKGLLEPYCDAMTIVVYLRPQFELALSAHSTALRAGHVNIEPLPVFTTKPAPGSGWISRSALDYESLLDRWAAVFGPAAVHPRLYTKDDLEGGDVVRDFASCIGLDLAGLTLPDRQNEALGPSAKIFLKAMNKVAKARVPITPRQRAQILASLPSGSHTGGRPGRSDVSRFQQQFAESNESLRQRWFPDRPVLFDIDYDAFPEEPDRHDVSPADVMEVSLRVMLALMDGK